MESMFLHILVCVRAYVSVSVYKKKYPVFFHVKHEYL